MKQMGIQDVCNYLVCIKCGSPRLQSGGDMGSVACVQCGTIYPLKCGILDLVPYDLLPETAFKEIKAMSLSLNDEKLQRIIMKEKWDLLQTHYHLKAVRAAARYLSAYTKNKYTLFAMGCGAGFEFRLMDPNSRPRRVIASDISWRAARAIPLSVKEVDGVLGVIACDFNHCPVQNRDTTVGLIFEALHHSDDVHGSLESLLTKCFDHLIMIEPTRNWLVNALEAFGLTMRIEYSGLKPDWVDIKKARAIAATLDYKMHVKTWWPIPDTLVPGVFKSVPILRRGLCAVVDIFSACTSLFNFGAMGAFHFSKSSDHASKTRSKSTPGTDSSAPQGCSE